MFFATCCAAVEDNFREQEQTEESGICESYSGSPTDRIMKSRKNIKRRDTVIPPKDDLLKVELQRVMAPASSSDPEEHSIMEAPRKSSSSFSSAHIPVATVTSRNQRRAAASKRRNKKPVTSVTKDAPSHDEEEPPFAHSTDSNPMSKPSVQKPSNGVVKVSNIIITTNSHGLVIEEVREQTPQPKEERGPTRKEAATPTLKEEVTPMPKEEVTTMPKEEVTTMPKEEVTTMPKEEVTPMPKEEVTTMPKEEVTTMPKEEVTTMPKEEVTTMPKEEVTTMPKEEVTPQLNGEKRPPVSCSDPVPTTIDVSDAQVDEKDTKEDSVMLSDKLPSGENDEIYQGQSALEDTDEEIATCDLGSSGESDGLAPLTDSDEEMRNFFPATRAGFKEVAGKVTRVTRADFSDHYRRRHLECFARSMESWKSFEVRHAADPTQLWTSSLNFDRYRDVFVDMDLDSLSSLDQFIYQLLLSSEEVTDQTSLNSTMAKLRRRYHISPSKRDIFERLMELQKQVEEKGKEKSTRDNTSCNVATSVKPKENNGVNGVDEPKTVKYDSRMQNLLRIKGTRSNSGVVVITVLTAPGNFSCASDCHYCPNEPGQPRSYLSTEPAVLRANQNEFDAVKQFYDRAMTLYRNGHVIDKIEILVLGGTWSGYPRQYQEEFCRDLYYAANIFPEQISTARGPKSLEEEQNINEKGECRIIGLTLETRPDRISPHEIRNLRMLGCTRVQLGIQHTNNGVLEYVNRGHTVEDTKRALYLLKENCYKVDIHIMPDLPSSSPQMDMEMFATILSDESLQADQWKIYPCEVAPFSKIEEWHKEGKYVPYFDTDSSLMTNLLMSVKRAIHPWIRLNRLIRDIPNPSIIAGTNVTNMRQLVMSYMKQRSIACHCIRCREVKAGNISSDAKLMVRQYSTVGGTEFFLSYETEDESKIFGFLRLRLPENRTYNPKVSLFRCLENCAFIRELHVYGIVVAHGVSTSEKTPCQHRGIGARLLLASEIIAAANGFPRMAVIAGIGTRDYYAKHGYVTEDTFMTKDIDVDSISERYERQKTQVTIRIPSSIQIHVIDLKDAVKTLEEPLPEPFVGKNPPPPVFKPTVGDNYSINVKRVLAYGKRNKSSTKGYTEDKVLFFDRYLGYLDDAMDYLEGPMKRIKENSLLIASVAIIGITGIITMRNVFSRKSSSA